MAMFLSVGDYVDKLKATRDTLANPWDVANVLGVCPLAHVSELQQAREEVRAELAELGDMETEEETLARLYARGL